jgi:hypothetical protein
VKQQAGDGILDAQEGAVAKGERCQWARGDRRS